MTRKWWFLFLYPVALPNTILGFVLAYIYRAHSFRWSEGCIEAVAGVGMTRRGVKRTTIWWRSLAQAHGFLIIYSTKPAQFNKYLRVHERVHVLQQLAGGPLYILAYLLSLSSLIFGQGFRNVSRARQEVPFEWQALVIERDFRDGNCPDAWGSRP